LELLKTRDMLRNLEMKRETVKADVTGKNMRLHCNFVLNFYDSCYKCEDGWEQHGGNCYYFSTKSSSWKKSRTECITKGGDLILLQKKNGKFWIGLTDSAVEGRWLWVDGLTFWFGDEPNSWPVEDPDGEDCAMMGHNGIMFWFDYSCKLTLRSICEKAAVLPFRNV
uniref:C-type lectin domain-containing protein n=1 Tax=Pundamilia nyererei TaxID=303518 RepID=A0A3B4FJQ5_9CICH